MWGHHQRNQSPFEVTQARIVCTRFYRSACSVTGPACRGWLGRRSQLLSNRSSLWPHLQTKRKLRHNQPLRTTLHAHLIQTEYCIQRSRLCPHCGLCHVLVNLVLEDSFPPVLLPGMYFLETSPVRMRSISSSSSRMTRFKWSIHCFLRSCVSAAQVCDLPSVRT